MINVKFSFFFYFSRTKSILFSNETSSSRCRRPRYWPYHGTSKEKPRTSNRLLLQSVGFDQKSNTKNDYAFSFMGYGDTEGLPKWFVDEEKQHCRASLPVTKEIVERYKSKMREIDQRPTKKVAEAKARKKRRVKMFLKRKKQNN